MEERGVLDNTIHTPTGLKAAWSRCMFKKKKEEEGEGEKCWTAWSIVIPRICEQNQIHLPNPMSVLPGSVRVAGIVVLNSCTSDPSYILFIIQYICYPSFVEYKNGPSDNYAVMC